MTETRKTSSSGGEKGSKLAMHSLIPTRALTALAERFGRGTEKYAARNWERGYEWSLSYDALQRHLNAFWGGEDIDQETGQHHLAAAMWHCVVLYEFTLDHPDFDDRSEKSKAANLYDVIRKSMENGATLEKIDPPDKIVWTQAVTQEAGVLTKEMLEETIFAHRSYPSTQASKGIKAPPWSELFDE